MSEIEVEIWGIYGRSEINDDYIKIRTKDLNYPISSVIDSVVKLLGTLRVNPDEFNINKVKSVRINVSKPGRFIDLQIRFE